MSNLPRTWLIWSIEHSRWWKPAYGGYTDEKNNAGRYTFPEALRIVKEANKFNRGDIPNEAMIHI